MLNEWTPQFESQRNEHCLNVGLSLSEFLWPCLNLSYFVWFCWFCLNVCLHVCLNLCLNVCLYVGLHLLEFWCFWTCLKFLSESWLSCSTCFSMWFCWVKSRTELNQYLSSAPFCSSLSLSHFSAICPLSLPLSVSPSPSLPLSHLSLYIYIYIYISWWDDKGPGFMYPGGLIRSPFFQKISSPPQPEAKKQEIRIVESRADKEPQKQVQIQRAPCQPYIFRAPYQLFKCFPPQNGRFWANFFKTFKKPPGLLISFSRSAERTTFRSGPQKEALSKFAENLTQIAPRIPQKERFFLLTTPKIAPFRRKNDFWPDLQKLAEVDHMRKSRKPWKN